MSVDAVKRVKDSEIEAKKIIEDAKIKASEIIKNAKEEAKDSYDNTISDAETKRNLLLEKAKEEGERNTKPILDEASNFVRKISQNSGNYEDFVKLVVERIVNNYGNS